MVVALLRLVVVRACCQDGAAPGGGTTAKTTVAVRYKNRRSARGAAGHGETGRIGRATADEQIVPEKFVYQGDFHDRSGRITHTILCGRHIGATAAAKEEALMNYPARSLRFERVIAVRFTGLCICLCGALA